MSAADQLKGLTLDGGWQVIEQMSQQPSSGGLHSVPYLVKDAQGKEHFLKAFDFSRAFEPGRDVIHELQLLTSIYENERDILEHCKSRRLSRVVVAVTFGYVQVPTMPGPSGTVYYLIFELAESDVRKQVDLKARLDCLTCLKILDDVTLGMMQIHGEAIAHQDLKPSNVLLYGKDGSRVADFGRSSRRGQEIWVNNLKVAGDHSYAPPEQLYSHLHADFVVRRVGCDLYLLGNLGAFLFSGVNITSAIFARLDPQFQPHNWAGTYEEVLPHIRRAFHNVITDLSGAIDPLVRDDIVTLIRELCNPDLAKRGHRKGLGSGNQYSLERYKSHTDLMLKRTSASVRARKSA
jgi:serine/threonine protein kinase